MSTKFLRNGSRWAVGMAACLVATALGIAALTHRSHTGATAAAPIVHRDARPNILLFTVDTVRADHLSAYGYARGTSPTLARLAARGTRFERAYAAASWTAPSVASILTGLLPSEHGVLHAELGPDGALEQDLLSPGLPSVAVAVRAAGYRTIGVVANGHMARSFGFARGFDDYECLGFVDLPTLRAAVAAHLKAMRKDGRPYFLWVHVFDPHAPYHPTAPSFSRFWPADRSRHPELDDVAFPELLDLMMSGGHTPQALEYVTAAYDSELSNVDAYLGELLTELDDGQLAVVFSSDHGEEFEDHGRMGHGHTLYDEVLRVPVVVALPGGMGARVVTSPISLVDLFPTIVELARGQATPGLAGRSLLGLMRGEPAPARALYAEIERDDVARAIIDGKFKYVVQEAPAAELLFDLTLDPAERHNLVSAMPERAAALHVRLDGALSAARALRPEVSLARATMTDEERARLRALGYAH